MLLLTCLPQVCWSGNVRNFDVYHLEDPDKRLQIADMRAARGFTLVADLNTLNLGFTKANHWIKIIIRGLDPSVEYKLTIDTITPDTIEVYQALDRGYRKSFIGEAFPTNERFLNYLFKSTEKEQVLYLKLRGNGQPVILPLNVQKASSFQRRYLTDTILSAIVYGIYLLILAVNLIVFFYTFERIYAYCFLFNIFSITIPMYFDGMMKLYVFPNAIYWNNESMAIAFCLTFIFSNVYISEFLNVPKSSRLFKQFFLVLNIVLLMMVAVSFWHPVGYNIYIIANIIITPVEVVLYSSCIFYVLDKKHPYFVMLFVGVVWLVFFSSVALLFLLGLLPIHFITLHAIQITIMSQTLVQTAALGKRLAVLMREQSDMQTTLIKSSEKYSHALINSIENERKRLAKEFHDSIGQNILVVRNNVLKLRKQYPDARLQHKFEELATITSETLDEIRLISQDLRPTVLDSIGLTASLRSMIHKLNEADEILFDLDCPQPIDGVICKDLEINIYRILQELTTNIVKHSQANRATVAIRVEQHTLVLTVRDNGQGFDAAAIASTNLGNGMSGIKERVNILKGKSEFHTAPNQGTTIHIKIPTAP